LDDLIDAPLQVLCIGSEEGRATVLHAAVRLRPHLQLHWARDGAAATRIAAQLQPSLVIAESELPDCGASELLPLLRLRYGWGSVPVVALARKALPCSESVFIDVWREPLDMRVVLSVLDRWLPPPPRATDAARAAASGLPLRG
jgi:CheY-like chemotaxis protein